MALFRDKTRQGRPYTVTCYECGKRLDTQARRAPMNVVKGEGWRKIGARLYLCPTCAKRS